MTGRTGARGPESRHGPLAQLLMASAPLSLILLAYAGAQWVNAPLADRGPGAGTTNRLGLGLNVAGPADADRAVFGRLPTVWLQERLVDGSVHWYDAAAALVYVTHFVSFPLVTGIAWFCLRDRFAAWLGALLGFTGVGVAGYCLYPAAPPWMAAELGETGPVSRISSAGWNYLHLDLVASLTEAGQAGSNPVAAMPSLHAGSALLVALFLWPLAGRWWRGALAGYVVLMALSLVYTGEHYVVDVLAGWLTALVGTAVGTFVLTRRAAAGGRDAPPVAGTRTQEVARARHP